MINERARAASNEGGAGRNGNGSAGEALSDPRRGEEQFSVRIVADARGRVLSGWCQGSIAQDEDGDAVDVLSSDARRWSTLGALIASWGGGPVQDLRRAVAALHASIEPAPLEVWNDRPGRTHDEVVDAFERAITSLTGSRAEARPPVGIHGANGRPASPQKSAVTH